MPSSGKIPAKYNVTTEFPQLGLHAAAVSGNLGLVQYALANGQPINSVQHGILPLHAACTSGNEAVVRELLAAGADVNAPRLPRRYSNDRQTPALGVAGSTPLHFAAASGHDHLIRILLEAGADPARGDKNGVTPVDVAESNGYVDVATLLRLAAAGALISESAEAGPSTEAAREPRLHIKRSLDNLLHLRSKSHSPSAGGMPRRSTSPGEASHTLIPPLPPLPLQPQQGQLPHISEGDGPPAGPASGSSTPSSASTVSAPVSGLPRSKPPTTARRLAHRRPRSAGQQEAAEFASSPSPSPSPLPPTGSALSSGSGTPTSPQLAAVQSMGSAGFPYNTPAPYASSNASASSSANPSSTSISAIPTHRLHKLGSKYSLRNLFKKATNTSTTTAAHDRSAGGESPLPSPPFGNASLPGSAGMSSDDLASPGPEDLPSPSPLDLPTPPPGVAPLPAVPVHATRSRGSSNSSGSGSGHSLASSEPASPPPPVPALPPSVAAAVVANMAISDKPASASGVGTAGVGVGAGIGAVGAVSGAGQVTGRPRKASEVTAPSPLATVTAWGEEHDEPEAELGKESEQEKEEPEEVVDSTEAELGEESDAKRPAGQEQEKEAEAEADSEAVDTPIADSPDTVGERRGIIHRSTSDPQRPKNLRFEVNGSGPNGTIRAKDARARGDSLSSGGSASASLSASASAFGVGVEVTSLDEARELVQETQRAILEGFDSSPSADGSVPSLEQQLAAYGETLAIEREFARREEKERERRQREEDRQRRRVEKELGFGVRRGSEGNVGLGLGFSLGSVGGMGKGSTVLLTYDPPPWLLDDIAARRSAHAGGSGQATPPSPPQAEKPVEPLPPNGTAKLSPPAHTYRHRPPALSLSSSGSSVRARRPPHRRTTSSSSRSGSGYGSVIEEPEDVYPSPWANAGKRKPSYLQDASHGRTQSTDSHDALNTSGPEIVHTGPTPVSSPGTGKAPHSASTDSSASTETYGTYAKRIWDTPPYSTASGSFQQASDARGLIESPSEMTLVARKLTRTPPSGAPDYTPEGTASPQSDTSLGSRRFGGLGIRGLVQTLTGR